MLPDKTTMCHRTGFAKSCFECVTTHGCRLWKRVELEFHPETGAPQPAIYDCLDSLHDLYWKDSLRRQVQTTASTDRLRQEVVQANDAGMANALMGINAQVKRIADVRANDIAQIAAATEPKMLTSGG